MEKQQALESKEICGIVIPISAIDGCSENHWNDVLDIVTDCIEEAGFQPNLVSNADDVGVIQKRIIQNLYDNPIIICDVSGKNPNVMFELGVRLAFDKPTIIIKDDKTGYSFDTSPIEHIGYPRDLRFNRIKEFKTKLIEKLKSTSAKAKTDENFSTFLKHFGDFKVAKIDKKEVPQQEFIMDELKSLRSLIVHNNKRMLRPELDSFEDNEVLDICCGDFTIADVEKFIVPKVIELPGVRSISVDHRDEFHQHLKVDVTPNADRYLIRSEVRKMSRPSHFERKSRFGRKNSRDQNLNPDNTMCAAAKQ